jgi:hypothetical protein
MIMNRSTPKERKIKTCVRIFLPWQYEKEENWLSEMAANGWLLEDYCFIVYRFSSGVPRRFIYRIDFKSTPKNDLEEYINLFTSSGWEHITTAANWQYFRIPERDFTTDIYSDAASKIEKFRRMANLAYILLFPNLVLLILAIPDLRPGLESSHFTLTIVRVFLHFLAVGLPAWWVVMLHKKIKELEEGE